MRDTQDVAAGVTRESDDRFRSLFSDYHSVMVAAAYNRLSSLSDAEDAAAEVFGAAWRRRDEHADVLTLAWLYGTLRNVVGNEYRRRERSGRRIESAQNEFELLEAGAGGLDRDEQVEIRAVVSRMEAADRELIWMAYWEELTREEMAAVLGCSVPTARVRLLRARNKLKVLLEAGQSTELAGDGDDR